jgi:hypothetical protein
MKEFIREHFGAQIVRWDDFDGEEWTYEVVYAGQLIRASSPALILRALIDLQEPFGRVLYLAASDGMRLAA